MFNPYESATMIRHHLIRQLQKLQQRIVLVERFGKNDVVLYPEVGYLGSSQSIQDLLEEQDNLLAQIRTLKLALDRSNEAELCDYLVGIVARHQREDK